MSYEEKYNKLLAEVNSAKIRCELNPFNICALDSLEWAMNEFSALCVEILEKLMEENSDILKRLKEK